MSAGDLVSNSVATAGNASGSATASPTYIPTPGNTRFVMVQAHSEDTSAIHAPDQGLGDPWILSPIGVVVVPNGTGGSNAQGEVALYSRVVIPGEEADVTYSSIAVGTGITVCEIEGTFAAASDSDLVSSASTVGAPPWDNYAPMGSLAVTGPALVMGVAGWTTPPSAGTFTIDRGTVVGSNTSGLSAPEAMLSKEFIAGSDTVAPTADYNAPFTAVNGRLGFIVAYGGEVTPPTPGPVIVVEDPDGVVLADLTDEVFDVKVRIALNDPGWGSFKVRRDSTLATSDVLKPGNYVRFTIPQIDPNPIFGFFLEGSGAPETPTITLVSSDEQGGEIASFGGRGSMAYWDRAIWLAQSFLVNWWPAYMEAEHGVPPAGTLGMIRFLPGTYTRYTVTGNEITGQALFTSVPNGFSSYYDSRKRYFKTINGVDYWTTLVHLTTAPGAGWYVKPWGAGVLEIKAAANYRFGNSVLMDSIDDGNKPGQVLYAMYGESQAADRPIHPLPGLTVDFDGTNDSDGNPWATTEALRAVSAELGDDYLSTIGKLTNTGALDVYMTPDLLQRAFNSYGRDLTTTVRFAKGLNIADELQREYSDAPTGTFAEIQGTSEGIIARVTVAGDPPREISVRGDSDDISVLETLGEAELALRELHSDTVAFGVDTPIVGHEDPDNGLYLPGPPDSANGNYWIGDLVTLHTGTESHDFNEATVRVAAITLTFTEANDLRATPEMISGFGGVPTLGSPASTGPTSTGAGVASTVSDLYQLISQKDLPFGYPSLNGDGLIDFDNLPTQWKQSVRAASTANVTLATGVEAGDSLDGVTLAEGDEILLKNQTTGSENGIYIVAATGAPGRRPDFDADVDALGAVVLVREGTTNAGTVWRLTNTTQPTIGTTALTWGSFGGGAPTSVDYLVGTASPDLSSEIVVGTTPGGELGGTWASPTVDATHSGSAHADFIAKSLLTTQDDIIVRDGSGPARLGKGSDGQVLTVDPTTHHLVWATPSGGGGSLTVEEVDGSPTDSAVTKIVFPNGTLAIASHVATYTPAGGGGSAVPPLDSAYSIDGTYGNHFTGASIWAALTRRNFTSGAETFQVGPNGTYWRIQTASRTAGDGYFWTAPGGDWTFAVKLMYRGVICDFGLGVVDTNGTGVLTYPYSVGSPFSILLTGVTTYTGYGGSYVQPGVTGTSPNQNTWQHWPMDAAVWISLRKSGTNYYVAVSRDGELWGPESAALAWAGTVDRMCLMLAPIGNVGSADRTVDIDWVNKIA